MAEASFRFALELSDFVRLGEDLIKAAVVLVEEVSSVHVEDLLGDDLNESALVFLEFVDALGALPTLEVIYSAILVLIAA